MKNTKAAWMDEPELPSKMDPPQKPLDILDKERAAKPLPLPELPMPQAPAPELPPAPMSMKDAASIMEASAKSLLDAVTTMQKAHSSILKIKTMEGQSGKDREVSSKADAYASEIGKAKERIESLAKEMGDFRMSLAKPSGPWLG